MSEIHRIAVVAWGSLVWDQRELRTAGPWHDDGPVLPIEFCRVARDGRLSLAIDLEHGVPVRCHWALSACEDVETAVEELRLREGMVDETDAGSLDVSAGAVSHEESYVEDLRAWAVERDLDAVVWTALRTNFHERARRTYSIEAAVAYLESLEEEVRARAHEYILRAPEQTLTPLRRALLANGWLEG